MFEYDVLKQLQGDHYFYLFQRFNLIQLIGLNHTPAVYEFQERKNGGQNFIVMRLLGKNLANQKKLLGRKMTIELAVHYLYNFVIGKGQEKMKVYIVDFGLAKQHIQNGFPVPMRSQADFRGTITFASLNAHLKIIFQMKSFHGKIVKQTAVYSFISIDSVKDEVKDIKARCLGNPEKYLWITSTKNIQQVKDIFYHLKNLDYYDAPNYAYIRNKLMEIKFNNQIRIIPQILPTYVQPTQYQQFTTTAPNGLHNQPIIYQRGTIYNSPAPQQYNVLNNQQNYQDSQVYQVKDPSFYLKEENDTHKKILFSPQLMQQTYIYQPNYEVKNTQPIYLQIGQQIKQPQVTSYQQPLQQQNHYNQSYPKQQIIPQQIKIIRSQPQQQQTVIYEPLSVIEVPLQKRMQHDIVDIQPQRQQICTLVEPVQQYEIIDKPPSPMICQNIEDIDIRQFQKLLTVDGRKQSYPVINQSNLSATSYLPKNQFKAYEKPANHSSLNMIQPNNIYQYVQNHDQDKCFYQEPQQLRSENNQIQQQNFDCQEFLRRDPIEIQYEIFDQEYQQQQANIKKRELKLLEKIQNDLRKQQYVQIKKDIMQQEQEKLKMKQQQQFETAKNDKVIHMHTHNIINISQLNQNILDPNNQQQLLDNIFQPFNNSAPQKRFKGNNSNSQLFSIQKDESKFVKKYGQQQLPNNCNKSQVNQNNKQNQ
ncbi:UNKNOWN [Stylonychia lemnae]|uniref:Uncharacterized protein n=1 Tax=Stylonychia lemnae TaxID=5949 RepID=A0A078B400_STYLE|nr:UNKNOWN [Stylonychia lemnae]|eukprot:CDW88961.1 UNKNOWN [Stylonychia lemnae]